MRILISAFSFFLSVAASNAQVGYSPTTYSPVSNSGHIPFGPQITQPKVPAPLKLQKQTKFSQYNDGGKADNFIVNHAGSIHDHYKMHGMRGLNTNGVYENGNAVTFATSWGNTPTGQVPDFDNIVLLPSGYGPYVRFGTQYTRSDQPFNTAGELPRRIDTGQHQIIFNNGTAEAKTNRETGGIATVPNPTPCKYSTGNCEEVRISGNIPQATYTQTTHNYNYFNLTNPTAPYTTMVVSEGQAYIKDVRIDGVSVSTHNGTFYSGGTLAATGSKSSKIEVDVGNLGFQPHAQGALFSLKWVNWAKQQDQIAANNQRKISAHNAEVKSYNRQLALFNKQEAYNAAALKNIQQEKNKTELFKTYNNTSNKTTTNSLLDGSYALDLSNINFGSSRKITSETSFFNLNSEIEGTKYQNTKGGRPLNKEKNLGFDFFNYKGGIESSVYDKKIDTNSAFGTFDLNIANDQIEIEANISSNLDISKSVWNGSPLNGSLSLSYDKSLISGEKVFNDVPLFLGGNLNATTTISALGVAAEAKGSVQFDANGRLKTETSIAAEAYLAKAKQESEIKYRYFTLNSEQEVALGTALKKSTNAVYGSMGAVYGGFKVNDITINYDNIGNDLKSASAKDIAVGYINIALYPELLTLSAMRQYYNEYSK